MSDNFYEILGVHEKATKDEIKRAYRSLQMKYHPDKNLGNSECMMMTQKINEAYETLGDEQKRQDYDNMRANPFMRMDSHSPHADVPIHDIFNMLFGAKAFHNMSPGGNVHIFNGCQTHMGKPVPIMKTIQITMHQAYHGVSIPVDVERWVMEQGCKANEHEIIYVDIPPGIDNEIIVIKEKGNVISEQCKGDVKVTVMVENNTEFKRVGLDLVLEKTITLKEALCGFQFKFEHLNGKNYMLSNNRGAIVSPGLKKLYPDLGMKRGERCGQLIVQYMVVFPPVLTNEQLDQLSEIL